jgi:hypothetical protein
MKLTEREILLPVHIKANKINNEHQPLCGTLKSYTRIQVLMQRFTGLLNISIDFKWESCFNGLGSLLVRYSYWKHTYRWDFSFSESYFRMSYPTSYADTLVIMIQHNLFSSNWTLDQWKQSGPQSPFAVKHASLWTRFHGYCRRNYNVRNRCLKYEDPQL